MAGNIWSGPLLRSRHSEVEWLRWQLSTDGRGWKKRLRDEERFFCCCCCCLKSKRKRFLTFIPASLHTRLFRVHPSSYQQPQLDIYWELSIGGQGFRDLGVDRGEGFNKEWRLLKHTQMSATGVMLRSWMTSAWTVAELPPHMWPNERSSVRLQCGESSWNCPSTSKMWGESNSHFFFFFFYTKPNPTVRFMCKREIFFFSVHTDIHTHAWSYTQALMQFILLYMQVTSSAAPYVTAPLFVHNCFTGKRAIKWNKGWNGEVWNRRRSITSVSRSSPAAPHTQPAALLPPPSNPARGV